MNCLCTKIKSVLSTDGFLTKDLLVVVFVTLCGLALRTITLSTVPSGFFCDEASTGYDAFSLLMTARDQHGSLLPLFAKSFGDYNEALYRYLTVPSVAVFGLNEFAVRLPAAIVGSMTIPVVYVIARILFDRKSAGFAALLLAFSPWHIQFSRVAFRAITLPLLFTLAVAYLLLSQRRHPKYLVLSAFFFALSLWTYASARVFVPLFCISALVYLKQSGHLRVHLRYASFSALLFVSVFCSLSLFWFSPAGMARASNVVSPDILVWIKNYIGYFSPRHLFWAGDPNLRHSPYGIGQLHLFEAATVCAGLVCCIHKKNPGRLLLLTWFALHPIPAALTAPQHSLRAIVGAPAFAILSGAGLSTIINMRSRGHLLECLKLPFLAIVIFLSFGFYVKRYYVDYPTHSAMAWQYGMREFVECTKEFPEIPVFVCDDISLAYAFVLFYEEYPPHLYHSDPISVQQHYWFYTDKQIGRYIFDHFTDLPRFVSQMRRCLIVCHSKLANIIKGNPHLTEIKVIRLPSGEHVFSVLEYDHVANKAIDAPP